MTKPNVTVRPLQEAELDEADRIMRVAFGTFVGLADPGAFMGDADYVRTRWAADWPAREMGMRRQPARASMRRGMRPIIGRVRR